MEADHDQLNGPELNGSDLEPGSRRNFFVRAGAASAAAGALALGISSPAAAKRRRKKRKVFKLSADEPYYVCGPGNPDCEGCNACQGHAKNKLFPSAEAADANRAHVGCRCGVVNAGKLKRKKFKKLFGPPRNPRRDSVDLRDARVRRIVGGALG